MQRLLYRNFSKLVSGGLAPVGLNQTELKRLKITLGRLN
jgi:hypothetical protein